MKGFIPSFICLMSMNACTSTSTSSAKILGEHSAPVAECLSRPEETQSHLQLQIVRNYGQNIGGISSVSTSYTISARREVGPAALPPLKLSGDEIGYYGVRHGSIANDSVLLTFDFNQSHRMFGTLVNLEGNGANHQVECWFVGAGDAYGGELVFSDNPLDALFSIWDTQTIADLAEAEVRKYEESFGTLMTDFKFAGDDVRCYFAKVGNARLRCGFGYTVDGWQGQAWLQFTVRDTIVYAISELRVTGNH